MSHRRYGCIRPGARRQAVAGRRVIRPAIGQDRLMTSGPLLRPLLLGVVTGLRSQLPLAVLAWSQPPSPADPVRLRALRSPAGRVAAGVAAAGELVMDKRPQTPSRLEPAVLGGRLASGALAGVLAAAAGAYAGAAYRKALPARTHTPDLPWALAEDAVAVTLATATVRSWPPPRPWWRRFWR